MTDSAIPLLPAAIERGVQRALAAASVYRIDSYGWLNETDVDPEWIGHAMWQTDQPDVDYEALFGETPVRRRPKDIEKEIVAVGEDFCGLMETSRLSIGLALIWHPQAHNHPSGENEFFWLHHTDAIIKLAIASARLRDLLVIACTGAMVKSYYKGEEKRWRVFKNARNLLGSRGLNDHRLDGPLDELPELNKQLCGYVHRRNQIVHEIATRMAKLFGHNMSELQQRFDREQENGFESRIIPGDAAESHLIANASEEESRQKVDRESDELIDWYKLLIKMSNCVFQVEYWSRVLSTG